MKEHSVIVVTNSHKDLKKLGHKLVNIVGTFEGVEAVLWEEKHYIANEPTIPSSQPIIFLGETQTALMLADTIQEWKYEMLNMKYGWIGNKAVIIVEKRHLSQEEINEFKALITTQKENIKKGTFLEKWSDKMPDINIKNRLTDLLVSRLFSSTPLMVGKAIFNLLKQKIDEKQIYKEQYEYLVNEFIAKGAREFIGV